MQQLPGDPQPRTRQFHRPQCNKTFCSQDFTAPDREPLLSAPCTSGLTCPGKADWGQVQGRAAHLARSPTAEKRQTHTARVSRGLVGLKGTGKDVGRARGGSRAHRRAGSRARRRRDCGAGPCGRRERAVPRGDASGPSLAGPRSRLFPGLLSAWRARTPRSAGRERWHHLHGSRGRRAGLASSRALFLRAPPPAESPGAAPPPGALLQPTSRRRPFPGLWPAAASGAGPVAQEPQARVPNRPVTKLEGFHANIHFLFLGWGSQLAFLFLYGLGFPNSLR